MSDAVYDGQTAGQWLRQARERHGMHIAILAAHIKVPTKKIEALESDDLGAFASPVFARSLALSICRVLKVDAEPVLALLPQPPSPALRTPSRVHDEAPVRFRSARPSGTGGPSRTTVMVAVGLVVVALVVAFAPDVSSRLASKGSATDKAPAGSVSEIVMSAVPMAQQVQVTEVATLSATSSAPSSAAISASSSAPSPASASASATSAGSQPMAQTPGQPGQSANPPAGPQATPQTATQVATSSPTPGPVVADVLGLRTKGDSWIQVLDARGQLLLSRVVLKGEQLNLGGALPLSVVIGRVDMTEVSVRGQAFSMAEIAQGNVARFEVK